MQYLHVANSKKSGYIATVESPSVPTVKSLGKKQQWKVRRYQLTVKSLGITTLKSLSLPTVESLGSNMHSLN